MVHSSLRDNRKALQSDGSRSVVPMRLFATWDIDRTASCCVPRIFTMSLNRLTVYRALEPDLASLVISLKLQGHKRTLRSNDISVQAVNGIIDADLDISFTLQYPHYIKKRNNCLLIMLQRRKKYKGRSLPGGFKTLALGVINLTEVLQNAAQLKELSLYGDLTDAQLIDLASPSSSNPIALHATQPTAKLFLHMLSSQPMEQDDSKSKEQHSDGTDDEDDDSSANEYCGGGSDSEVLASAAVERGTAKANFSATRRLLNRQKNLKQKFAAILKRFKIPEEEVLKAVDPHSQQPTEQEIRELFDELENFSNSDPEFDADTLSVKSTPKPSLQPYFSQQASNEVLPDLDAVAKESEESKESGGDSQGDLDTTDPEISEAVMGFANSGASTSRLTGVPSKSTPGADQEQQKPASLVTDKKKETFPKSRQTSEDLATNLFVDTKATQQPVIERPSGSSANMARLRGAQKSSEQALTSAIPYTPISEQLSIVLPADEKGPVPDLVLLLSATDIQCQDIVDRLREKLTTKLLIISTQADAKAVLSGLVNRIQKYCNTNAFQPQNAVKLAVVGGDRLFAQALKSYTEIFAEKSNEWMHYVRFFVIGPPWSTASRFLSSVDRTYSGLFNVAFWREWWDKAALAAQETTDVVSRISKYVQNAKLTVSLPIAEAMLQLKDTGGSNDSSHIFVPFVVELRKATGEGLGADASFDSQQSPPAFVQASSGSPPASANFSTARETATFSPTAHCSPPTSPHFFDRSNFSSFSSGDAQELQIEYWTAAGGSCQPQTAGSVAQKKESVSNPIMVASSGANTSGVSLPNAPIKSSLKSLIKSLVIARFPSGPLLLSEFTSPALMVQFVKEKRKDKMLQKLGMKNKEKVDGEQKCQSIEGISRLICSGKQNATMKVNVDGVDWANVKFFQVSSQWQTHVKILPIALFRVD